VGDRTEPPPPTAGLLKSQDDYNEIRNWKVVLVRRGRAQSA
jgi:hypothetical protein